MAKYCGQDVIVTIEQPDGQVFRGKAQAVNISRICEPIGVTCKGDAHPAFVSGWQRWEMELSGTGDLFWGAGDDLAHRTATGRSASEWKCDFCGSINLRQHRSCQKCNAARSFLYD